MFEFLGLIGVIFIAGLCFLAVGIVLLPFYLLFKLLGFAVRIGLAGLGLALAAMIMVPIALVVGAVLLVKLLILAIPLLILFAAFSWLAGFTRGGNEPETIYVEAAERPQA